MLIAAIVLGAVILIYVISALVTGGVALAKGGLGQKIWDGFFDRVFGEQSFGKDPTMDKVIRYLETQGEENTLWMGLVPPQKVQTVAPDGVKLTGFYFPHQDSHKWLLGFHGYRGTHEEMIEFGFASHFFDLGYHVILPDQRGCGKSGGKVIGMGWLERLDALEWITFVLREDPEAEIVLFGDSLGASTVLAASGENLPEAVKAIVADSGYRSVWHLFYSVLRGKVLFPKLYLAIAGIRIRAMLGTSAKKASMEEAVRRSSVPILFFHGEADTIVPFDNLKVLFDAKETGRKQMVAVPKAQHVCASFLLPEYWDIVRDFLKA